jgi:hypothetical protein
MQAASAGAMTHLLYCAAGQNVVGDVRKVQNLEKSRQERRVYDQDVRCCFGKLVGLRDARQATSIATCDVVAEIQLLKVTTDCARALALLVTKFTLRNHARRATVDGVRVTRCYRKTHLSFTPATQSPHFVLLPLSQWCKKRNRWPRRALRQRPDTGSIGRAHRMCTAVRTNGRT